MQPHLQLVSPCRPDHLRHCLSLLLIANAARFCISSQHCSAQLRHLLQICPRRLARLRAVCRKAVWPSAAGSSDTHHCRARKGLGRFNDVWLLFPELCLNCRSIKRWLHVACSQKSNVYVAVPAHMQYCRISSEGASRADSEHVSMLLSRRRRRLSCSTKLEAHWCPGLAA